MGRLTIRRLRKRDAVSFLSLIDALADFEKLNKPTSAARRRLITDAFGKNRRFDALLALDGRQAVGYAIIFETYSSFRALPTLYLEDIFILPGQRGRGVGKKLFSHCLREAISRGAGRMEWMVLDWNTNAIRFYDRIGARKLTGWLPYRIDRKNFVKLSRRLSR